MAGITDKGITTAIKLVPVTKVAGIPETYKRNLKSRRMQCEKERKYSLPNNRNPTQNHTLS